MAEEPDGVRRRGRRRAGLDRRDRMLLALLAEDARLTNAELGARVSLSAPAVHERVRRLHRIGAIRRIAAQLDAARIGRPLLAFVHVETEGWCATDAMMALRDIPELDEMHTVAGETGLILKVRTEGAAELEALLKRIYAIDVVRTTRTQIVLSTQLERGPRPSASGEHADDPMD